MTLRVIERSIPVVLIQNHFHLFGLEFHFNLNSSLRTQYEVWDEFNSVLYIGNTPTECEHWIKEQQV